VLTSALEIVAANEDLKKQMEDATPLRRLGEPEEIAATMLYLAAPSGAYITGKILEVDGGTEYPALKMPLPDLEPGNV
jgi:7-alpha-hydroxysteroid dehydrogenase